MQKERFFQALGFYSIYPFIWIIAWLPLWALYLLSDIVFIFVAALGYRRKIITSNLQKAYPDKDNKFYRKIRMKFYRHLCDLFVEIIVMVHINPAKILKRMEFVNLNLITEAIDKGKDIVVVIGHYGNWEWVPAINLKIKASGCSVYRPLKNPYFDRFMLNLRSLFNSTNLPMKSTVKEIVKLKRANQRFVLGLIADQSPSKIDLQFWTSFLTQKTPVLLGPEKISKLADAELFFWQIEKPKRGKYRLTVVPYPGNIKTDAEYVATKWHVKLLEEQIYRNPQLWLWSHKRWKYQDRYNGQHFE